MTQLVRQTVEIFAGDSHTLAFSVVDAAGTAIDLTGATIKWKMARSGVIPAEIIKSIGSGITVTNAAGGQFTVDLTTTDTAPLLGLYYFQALVIDSAGNQSVIAHGDLTLNLNIKET